MSIQEKCRILDHQQIAPQHFKLTLVSKYISAHGLPGQFINVKVSDSYDPLLRRPLSLHRIMPEEESFELLYEVVGKGTELLSKRTVGSEIDVLGPLGSGFSLEQKEIAVLVGGGMGVAPLLALAEALKDPVASSQGPGAKAIYVLLGARNRARVLAEKEFRSVTEQVLIATDDGSYGKKGFVSDILIDVLENTLEPRTQNLAVIYACGPDLMLKAVTDIAFQKKIPAQVSMEQRMACGIGTCLGCVIGTKNGYKKVCDDGPVFNSEELIWQD
ncbi:MAG: dihydroorotate dehydrogenase electron transfer subunit [Candidatus Saganbacteria bacterium]|nr:dihydroorotate dehydrogenase electron transfer subunit [Candidatus Saganbacteria bacterium]